MNILISAHTYQGYGLGNIYRSLFLYEYIANQTDILVHFESNNEIAYSLASKYSIELKKTLLSEYDVVIYDSPYNFLYNIALPIEETFRVNALRSMTKCFIGLDYCRFSENICDIAINLCNHNTEKISEFNGKIYEGIQYAILKPDVLEAKGKTIQKIATFLVSIGGEDSHSYTLQIITKLRAYTQKFSVVVGPWHKDFEEIQKICNFNQIYHNVTNMGELISAHDIIICNGGTTLLESMYLEKQIIPVAQSEFEKHFISCCSSQFYTLDDIPILLNQNNETINYSNIDTFGKKRILSIVLQHG
ncbi:MAG TPA: hypothetical protein P5243_03670 [Bacteroidales bacterium]|jgi:spore coat polysaccharide biosynthesis predicted glycosyltransferase SpsG|nr:hypothetical protein [Bacteroidales bacterium]HRS18579.1 hypothetical protein [Bacteroidales bacterium]